MHRSHLGRDAADIAEASQVDTARAHAAPRRGVASRRARASRYAPGVCLLLALAATVSPAAAADPVPATGPALTTQPAGARGAAAALPTGIDVGDIAELDLGAMRSLIDRNDDRISSMEMETLALSLEDSVKLALEQNLDLQIVELGVEASDAQLGGTRSKFHPVLGVDGNFEGKVRANGLGPEDDTFNDQEATVFVTQEVPTGGNVKFGVGYGRSVDKQFLQSTDGTVNSGRVESKNQLAGLGIEVTQPLLKGGRTYVSKKRILDAQYDTEISQAELRMGILRVSAETKAAYYQVVRAIRQIEVVERAIGRDEELIGASGALFDAGRVSKVDVFSADIQRSNDLRRRAAAGAEFELASNRLRKVLGLPAHVAVEVTDQTIPFHPVAIRLDDWLDLAAERRPELLKIRSEMKKTELAMKVGKNAKLPDLDVRGGYQPGFDWQSYNWNAGLNFRYQIGSGAGEAQYDQARIDHARARQEYARQLRDIDLEVREIEISLRENLERLLNVMQQVESARAKGEIARGRFEMGLANNKDITDADEELIRSESLMLTALVDYATNLAELEARIGGPL